MNQNLTLSSGGVDSEMTMATHNQLYCLAFYHIVGGEVYSTSDDVWVVCVDNELFNETGRVEAKIAYYVSADYYTGKKNFDYSEYVDDALENYEFYLEDRTNKIVDDINKTSGYTKIKQVDDYNFTLAKDKQSYRLQLYSEDVLATTPDDFLKMYASLQEHDLVPKAYEKNKFVWEGHTVFVYIITDMYNYSFSKMKKKTEVLINKAIEMGRKMEAMGYYNLDFISENILVDIKTKKLYFKQVMYLSTESGRYNHFSGILDETFEQKCSRMALETLMKKHGIVNNINLSMRSSTGMLKEQA